MQYLPIGATVRHRLFAELPLGSAAGYRPGRPASCASSRPPWDRAVEHGGDRRLIYTDYLLLFQAPAGLAGRQASC